ncbi:family 10 glycosylhydrolase [Cohnella nanjingensis]|uniref:Family 10 glycosylhydrolase n=1 Tax=Cohnella nanjingensis TaxID=1387779 RepID=A0A7X0RTA5_9BACL|nr:family 10 glycosylhydrolase [Cohnella nanjingensis]MBB6673302.1 family 10 glycosylhydrolase [Cohnella nanjingensis]
MNRLFRTLTLVMVMVLLFAGAASAAGTEGAAQPLAAPQIVLEDGRTLTVAAVDQERQNDQLAVYTRNYGEKTKPFASGTVEYIVADGAVVVKSAEGSQGTFIPTTGYVLSASGTAAAALGDLAIGALVETRDLNIPVLPSKYFTVQGVAVGIDRVDGPRGAGEVVLYQPAYGPSTRQNAWGMELAVSGGKVTKVTDVRTDSNTGAYLDNDTPIPADGYVVSIQSGSSFYDRLTGKVAVGDPVELVTDSLIYSAGKMTYDAFNPKTREDNPGGWDDVGNTPYPGMRGTDQLIVYDSSYGASTGTNPWGFEAVVNDRGFVIASGGNDNAIPAGGYVLSGHGAKNTWLTKNALVGAKVRIDKVNKQVLLIFTPESYLDRATISVDNAEKALQTSRSQFLDVPYKQIEQKIAEAKTLRDQAKTAIESGATGGLFALLNKLDQSISDTHFMNFESRKVDNRGLWLRPKETNLAQVREHLDRIQATNINSIYLETWWDGYTIYPTKVQDSAQNPIYQGFDVLKAYLDEGKKRGIEIHAWVENFFAGGPVVERHPDWLLISRKGDNYEVGTNGAKWYWLNPALPQARDFVSAVYKELLQKYDVDSLHLDYARYPGSGDYTNDFGYDAYTRDLFKKQAAVDPLELHPGDAHWDEWLQFRADIINSWVDRLVSEARKTAPGIIVTAAVWPNYDEAPKSHAQQTKYWTDHNYIHNLFHMSYVPDATIIVQDLKSSLAVANGRAFVTSGIGTFIDLTKTELVRQIDEAVKNGADGTALFEFESLYDYGYDRELTLGVYRNKAVMPDYRTTKPLYTLLADMARKIDEVYVPLGGMNAMDAAELKKDLNNAMNVLQPDKKFNHGIATSAKQKLGKLEQTLAGAKSVQTEAANRIRFDLNFAGRIVDLYFVKEGEK